MQAPKVRSPTNGVWGHAPEILKKLVKDGRHLVHFKARYGGSNMKKINNGGRLLIFYMMEGIKKVN